MKQTLSCLVNNKPGVLEKIAASFADIGINIYSLAAGEVEEEDKSRMTIVVDADEEAVKKATDKLKGLKDVIQIHDFTNEELISMELLLIKVRIKAEQIPQILQIAELFNAQVISVTDISMVLSLASGEKRIDGMVRMLKPMGIIEMSRSGKLAVCGVDR